MHDEARELPVLVKKRQPVPQPTVRPVGRVDDVVYAVVEGIPRDQRVALAKQVSTEETRQLFSVPGYDLLYADVARRDFQLAGHWIEKGELYVAARATPAVATPEHVAKAPAQELGLLERAVAALEGLANKPAPLLKQDPAHVVVHVPEQPAPIVHNHVDVNVPTQPPPVIENHIAMPQASRSKSVKVQRNGLGQPVRYVVEEGSS